MENESDEPHVPIERAIDEPEPEDAPVTNKYFYIILGITAVIFIALFLFSKSTTPTGAVTFDELHRMNVEGKLSEKEGYMYNGFSFIFVDGLWYTKIAGRDVDYRIPLHFGPRGLADVAVTGELNEEFNVGSEVYVVINPISSNQDYIAVAASELAQNLAVAIQRRPIAACDRNETDLCTDRPIVTCDTTDKTMVHLVDEPGPSVELEGRCIIARGEGIDILRAIDRVILQWYGIQ